MALPEITLSEPDGSGGPTLVLGHSLGTDPRAWSLAVPMLAQHFTVVHLTLPGHGSAPVPTAPFSMDELADAVAEHVRDLVASERVWFAGVSLSGALALTLGLRHAAQFDGVASIGAGACLGDAAGWHERAQLVRSEGTGVLVDSTRERWFTSATRREHPDTVAAVMRLLAETDNEGYARCAESLATYDLRGSLGDIATPVLAIGGAHDPVAPASAINELSHSIANARGIVLENAAHQIPSEQPDQVVEALRSFARVS